MEDVYSNAPVMEVKVYTLGTNSWRWIQGEQPYKKSVHLCYTHSWWGHRNLTTWTHVNGVFYRIIHLPSSKIGLLSFDIVHEMYREVPNPECFDDSRCIWDLTVLKGCLCLSSRRASAREFVDMEVWMMVDNGVEESWTKLFNITSNDNVVDIKRMKPVWWHKNGEVVMVGISDLFIYDSKKDDEVKSLKSQSKSLKSRPKDKEYFHFETEIYIGSLVSLKSHE